MFFFLLLVAFMLRPEQRSEALPTALFAENQALQLDTPDIIVPALDTYLKQKSRINQSIQKAAAGHKVIQQQQVVLSRQIDTIRHIALKNNEALADTVFVRKRSWVGTWFYLLGQEFKK